MPKSDLDEFPDGGRATLVRRYSPALTKRELSILASCPYETGRSLTGAPYRTARILRCAGLLEQSPEVLTVFRVTEAGEQVVYLWKSAGWAP